MLSVSVLGPVELRRDGVPLPLRAGKTTEVLVRLALEAGTPVSSERLIEDLWGDGAVATARNTLQTKVSRLRRELGDATLVTGDRSGYTLHVPPDAVDALEVLTVAEEVRRALDAGDAATALRLADEAAARFRGPVLLDAGDGEWVAPFRAQLEEVRLRLVEQRIEARLALGGAGELTDELEVLIAAHPLREHLWVLLITALYRDGRQADALTAYRRVRAVLAEELGIEPGTALQAVERQVLDQDPALRAPRRRAPGNLPALTAELVGRADELAEVQSALGARLVTVVGPAGVGKTRLAIEVARAMSMASGAWLVRLDPARSPAEVVETIAAALRVADGSERQLLERVRGAELLIVLDNCEHVIDAVAALVSRLLDDAPGLRVLCTSQMPLGSDGEVVVPLAPLPAEASVALFASRAAGHRRSFALDAANEAQVRDLCAALDGLPLAIELAAARARTLSVPEIARRLDDRFTLLRDPTARRPERRRALDAAIAWSYDLLFPDDQRGLWALACFRGGPTIDAVERVLAALDVPTGTVIDVVGRLADRSLVTVDEDDHGALRYRLLDSVRAFAADRSRDAGADAPLRTAHARWYADAADAAREGARGPDQAVHLAFARSERADLDAALHWATESAPSVAMRIVDGFGWAWIIGGEGAAAAGRIERALAVMGDAIGPGDRARAWAFVAWLAAGSDVDEARAAAEKAVGEAAATGDDRTMAVAALARGFVAIQQARAAEAVVALNAARATFERVGARWEAATGAVLSVHAALVAGDPQAAAAACAVAEPMVRPLGDDWGAGHLDAVLGRVAGATGDPRGAAIHLERAAASAGRLGFATSEGYHLVNLACARHDGGNDPAAFDALDRAIEIGVATAEPRLTALARTHRGRLLLAGGDIDAAIGELAAADEWFRRSGGGDGADLAAELLAITG